MDFAHVLLKTIMEIKFIRCVGVIAVMTSIPMAARAESIESKINLASFVDEKGDQASNLRFAVLKAEQEDWLSSINATLEKKNFSIKVQTVAESMPAYGLKIIKKEEGKIEFESCQATICDAKNIAVTKIGSDRHQVTIGGNNILRFTIYGNICKEDKPSCEGFLPTWALHSYLESSSLSSFPQASLQVAYGGGLAVFDIQSAKQNLDLPYMQNSSLIHLGSPISVSADHSTGQVFVEHQHGNVVIDYKSDATFLVDSEGIHRGGGIASLPSHNFELISQAPSVSGASAVVAVGAHYAAWSQGLCFFKSGFGQGQSPQCQDFSGLELLEISPAQSPEAGSGSQAFLLLLKSLNQKISQKYSLSASGSFESLEQEQFPVDKGLILTNFHLYEIEGGSLSLLSESKAATPTSISKGITHILSDGIVFLESTNPDKSCVREIAYQSSGSGASFPLLASKYSCSGVIYASRLPKNQLAVISYDQNLVTVKSFQTK